MTEMLRTGIDVLDRKLDGGIPAGRVVVLSASPASQSELFLYEMAAVRPTIYLTTERTRADVRESLAQTGTSLDGVEIHRIGTTDRLTESKQTIQGLRDRSTLIIDPMGPLERTEPNAYRTFLNDIKSRTVETGSLTLLHCLDGQHVPEQRDRTKYLADAVFSLSTTVRGGSIQNSLAIPKFRRGEALPDAIKLKLTAGVSIDVSRKIA